MQAFRPAPLRPCRRKASDNFKSVVDLDGNGKADVLLRHKVSGQNVGWLMNGLTIVNSAFLPALADANWQLVGAR